MLMEKQQVLYNAPGALNKPDQPWYVTVEGDTIVANWKWMDATFFAPSEISDETKAYFFTVTLTDKGKYKELDKKDEKKSTISVSGGNLSFGTSSSSFKGKMNQKSFAVGVGQNKQTGQVGLVGFKYDTTPVKKQVRDYLESCGWKKAGMFG